ncbi:NAD(P)H-dependent flavin oxidoreductase YrpB (nitropropane dioxygenase family) [Sinorhizobium terangae]|nr:NAD(P)H-dependent flavin oxidoreductase YrpB (nitropropane dioxygenase family) [Sinorhizobium terangae]
MLLIGTATAPEEAQLLEESGVDAITLQGFEAGGHRGTGGADGHGVPGQRRSGALLVEASGTHTKDTDDTGLLGRLARGIENRFMDEMKAEAIMPFPAQNKFTRDIRSASAAGGSADFQSLWAGAGQGDLWQGPASELIDQLFSNEGTVGTKARQWLGELDGQRQVVIPPST